jgi:esterase
MAVELYWREYGEGGAKPLLLLHGLFGSSANWHGIARRLARSRRILVPDLRGHGRSPAGRVISYQTMAEDLTALLDSEGIGDAAIVGHSMGGKAAMWLALERPERVRALVVADMAPVSYGHRFDAIIDALRNLDISAIADRREAGRMLSEAFPDAGLRAYLLQSLVREAGGWRWRLDLTALAASVNEIPGFPDPRSLQYGGPALFIYGTESGYVTGEHLPVIRRLFPLARLRAVAGAGHWVYSDQPDAFVRALESFLPR